MQPRLTLINPPVFDFAAFDMWARPAGLLYLAGTLAKAGFQVDIIDALWWKSPHHIGPAPRRRPDGSGKFHRTPRPMPATLEQHGISRPWACYGLTPETLVAALAHGEEADLVLVTSMMTYWYPGVKATIEAVRTAMPRTPVALGGIYATLLPDHAASVCAPDYLLRGHRFHTIVRDVTSMLEDRGAPRDPEPCSTGDLDLEVPLYASLPGADSAAVLTAVGCAGGCDYCASHLLAPVNMTRPLPQVVRELCTLNDLGIKEFAFLDDALMLDRGRFLDLADLLAATGRTWRFHCPNGLHANAIDPPTARAMRAAGFATIKVGDRRLSKPPHGLDSQAMGSAVENLRAAGYDPRDIGLYFLVGFPSQSPAQALDEARSLARLGVRVHVNNYSPVPGTPAFAAGLAGARHDFAAEPLWQNTSLLPHWSREFSPETLARIRQYATSQRGRS